MIQPKTSAAAVSEALLQSKLSQNEFLFPNSCIFVFYLLDKRFKKSYHIFIK